MWESVQVKVAILTATARGSTSSATRRRGRFQPALPPDNLRLLRRSSGGAIRSLQEMQSFVLAIASNQRGRRRGFSARRGERHERRRSSPDRRQGD